MQTELPKTDPPKRRRRWFQFSLRTLLIFTLICAIPCAFVGWQAKIVRERNALRTRLMAKVCEIYFDLRKADNAPSLPWYRLALGDEYVNLIVINERDVSERGRIEAVFPEAGLLWLSGSTKLMPYPEFDNDQKVPSATP